MNLKYHFIVKKLSYKKLTNSLKKIKVLNRRKVNFHNIKIWVRGKGLQSQKYTQCNKVMYYVQSK